MSHRTFLKPSLSKTFLGHPVPLFYHKRTVMDLEAQVHEWIVDRSLKHHAVGSRVEFLTTLVGYDITSASWEPVDHFNHGYNSEFLGYCKEVKLPIDITKYLEVEPKVRRRLAVRAIPANSDFHPTEDVSDIQEGNFPIAIDVRT